MANQSQKDSLSSVFEGTTRLLNNLIRSIAYSYYPVPSVYMYAFLCAITYMLIIISFVLGRFSMLIDMFSIKVLFSLSWMAAIPATIGLISYVLLRKSLQGDKGKASKRSSLYFLLVSIPGVLQGAIIYIGTGVAHIGCHDNCVEGVFIGERASEIYYLLFIFLPILLWVLASLATMRSKDKK